MNTGGQMKIWAVMTATGFIGVEKSLKAVIAIIAAVRLMRYTSSAGAEVNVWSGTKMENGGIRIVTSAMDVDEWWLNEICAFPESAGVYGYVQHISTGFSSVAYQPLKVSCLSGCFYGIIRICGGNKNGHRTENQKI